MNIIFKGSPNFSKRTKPIKRIVIHWFGSGTLESANTRFQNVANQVSAHYGISKGRIWQWVKESDVAWHSGISAVNDESIGIEHDAISNGHSLSEQDYQLSGQLIAEIAKRHNIPLNRASVIGHREVKPTGCPGTIDIDKIIKIANQYLMPTTKMSVTIVANKIAWNIEALLPKLSEWFEMHSGGRLEVVFDFKRTNFDNIPLSPFLDKLAVDINWYRENITPLATGQMTLLVLNPDQYQNPYGTWGFMTYGDPEKPVRGEVSVYDDPGFPEAHLFVHRAFHEICHALFFLTGQYDSTHGLLLQNPPKRTELLNLIDYPKLQLKLLTIKPTLMNQAKVVKSKNSNTVFICYPIPDMDYLQKKANLEGFQIPANIPNTDSL